MNARFPATRSWLVHIAWLAVISILCWVIFQVPLPPQFKRQGIFLMDEFIFVVLIGLVFFSYRQSGWGSKYLRLGLILIAFTLPLVRLWETAESTWNIVLGLLPWADAAEYYLDANRLLHGGLFSSFSGRRPLFASLLAVLLKLSDQNLQISLIVFTVINAVVVFFLVEEVHNEWGALSAIVTLYLAQLFYRPFVGTTLTEQFGYPIGLLALVVFIRAVKTSRVWLFVLASMLLTYALLIRAGAFFVLPVLVLFAVVHYAENRHQYPKVALLMIAAVAIPFLPNAWLGRAVASPDAVEFANFADTLYGQAMGGIRWTEAAVDHPELTSMVEPERSQYLYRLAFEEIKHHPLGLVKGSMKAFADFIRPGPLAAFGFLTLGNKTVDFLLQIIAAILFLLGSWQLWMNRDNSIGRFMLFYWAGTLVSIPFLPPADAGIRPYAATIPSVFLPVCFVFSSRFFRRLENHQQESSILPIHLPYGFAFAIILFSLIGAPLVKALAQPVTLQPAACGSELIPIDFELTRGSYILLSYEENGVKTEVPIVMLSDVHKSFDDFPYGDFAGILRKMRQPVLVAMVNNLQTGAGVWVVAPPELSASEGKYISGCAEQVSASYPVYRIESMTTHP